MDKIRVDKIITNGAVITMDAANNVYERGAVAVKDNKIEDLGPNEDITSKYEAEEVLDARGNIVMPGLIDTHCHTGQMFERGVFYRLSKEMKLEEPIWKNYLIPFEASLTDEDIYLSALFTYSNLLKSGTTCFADPGGPRPEMMGPALEKTGIRGVLARSTLDLAEGIPPEMQDTRAGILEKGERFFNEWNGRANGRARVWMGMRQIMVCSEELLIEIKELADQLRTNIHIHLAEGAYEVDYAILKSGHRAAEYLESIGFLDSNIHAAHSVLLTEKELDLYKEYDVSVGHCPAAVFAYCGVTKIPQMMRRNLRVGLGTDGALASGGSLDLFRQAQISYYTQVATFGLPYRDTDPIFIEDLLRIATHGGARALSWDDEIGSLEVGKKADLILLTRNDLDVLPSYDPVFTAASNASAAQVRTVMVDGKIVVKDGKLMNVDEEELKDQIRERAPQIIQRFMEKVR